MSTAAIIIAAQRRKYWRKFLAAGATTPERAIVPEEHGMRQSLLFRNWVKDGVIKQAGENRYYLDEERDKVLTKNRRNIVLIILAVLVVILLINLFLQER